MPDDRQSDIMHWHMFWRIDPDLFSEIKYVQVDSRQNAFFVTNEDKVYGIGNNADGLINGVSGACNEPVCIHPLCGKNIVSITFGHCPCVYGLTSDGDVYVWGRNSEGQLGLKNYRNQLTPKICEDIKTQKIKQVACGYYHTLMLSNEGKVFASGSNVYGQLGMAQNEASKTKYSTKPSLVHGLPTDRPVDRIACSTYSSFAVIVGGHAFSWGSNDSGELGLKDTETRWSPHRVGEKSGLIFKSIACGYNHTVALNFLGRIYCWGNNKYGQLGFEGSSSVTEPKQLDTGTVKFSEIGANCSSNFNAALTWEDEVYVWGAAKTSGRTQPLRTNFKSMNQAFALMADVPLSVKAIQPYEREVSVTECLVQQLNDRSFSDVTFKFGEAELFAHSAILRMRSEHLRVMLSSNLEPNCQIEITGYSCNVYRTYLRFLYTGEVEIVPEEAIDLLQLANEYMEPFLKKKCELFIIRSTNVENVFTNYMMAKRVQALELEEFCFNYAMSNLNAATQTDGFKCLPGDLIKQFVSLAGFRVLFET